jgi:MFS family permease
MLVAILLEVTPEAHRGFSQGFAVGIATLPGFIAPLVTGLMIQAAGSNAMQGLQQAYMLAALLLLVCGVVFTGVVRPDEAMRVAKLPAQREGLHGRPLRLGNALVQREQASDDGRP